MKKRSPKQLINAELAAKARNVQAKDRLKAYVPETERSELLIAFGCECSDPACTERVLLTLDQYEKLHADESHFVIAAGHDEPAVENVVGATGDKAIVEKTSIKDGGV